MNTIISLSRHSGTRHNGFQLLFLVLLSSIFLRTFFPEIANRTSEVMRENPTNAINLARVILVGFVGFWTIGISILRIDKFVRNIRGPLGWMIVYATVALASTVYSSVPLVSAGKALEVLVDVLFFVAVGFVFSSCEIVSLWNLLLSFLSASLVAVWVSALATPSAGFAHIPGAPLPLQLQGAFPTVNPNDLGEIAAIVAATAFYRMVRRRSVHDNERILWGGVFVLGLVSVIFAQARTSVAALAAALIAILFMTRKLSLLPMFAVSGVALIAGGGGPALREYYMRGQSSELFFTMTGRLTVWEAAWKFFRESPLLGHGFYTAHRLDLNVRLRSITSFDVSNIDNTFLEVLLGVGLIGLLPILAALFQMVGRFLRISRAKDLGGRLHQSRCEIVGALIIVFIRALNGPTFQDHSISLIVLLISMAFVHILMNQQAMRQRSRLRILQFCRSLMVKDRCVHDKTATVHDETARHSGPCHQEHRDAW